MFCEIGSLVPRFRKVIAVLRPYQKIDDLLTMLTLTKAIVERTTALQKLSSRLLQLFLF